MWAKNKNTGFTIVELLIVVVVIAILAAITIVSFNGIQDRAKTSQANTELRYLEKAILIARNNEGKTLTAHRVKLHPLFRPGSLRVSA